VYAQGQAELLHNPMLSLPRSAIPAALMAGLLLRPWYVKLGAVALTVAAVFGLLTVLAAAAPDEVDSRLAAAHVERGQYFVVSIPGYRPVPNQGLWYLEPEDPPYLRAVSVYADLAMPPGDECKRAPMDTDLAQQAPCTIERPGLAYLEGPDKHEYYYRRGPLLVRIVGTRAVDRDVLRTAALSVRPATDDELLTELPLGPRQHRSFMGVLKGFAKSVVG
jgi:hypothetical protein